MKLEFFFDCSSPWTYMAFEMVQPLAEEFGVNIIWRPILVGGIFNQVNPGVEFFKVKDRIPQRKLDHMLKDIGDWEKALGIRVKFPPAGHPVNSVKVMRACLLLEPQGKLVPFARRCFQAYFGEDHPLSDDAVITDICRDTDIDPKWLLSAIAEQSAKDALRMNVDEAIARGAFGSPTMFLDDVDMYFGVDRIQLLRKAMERKRTKR
ncbi:2-hydroxychromene-2-carboxylate isomerase [Bradyrhizobium sp. AUGA SZCCT0042]|uniref:2-hydroxychromene-2-carboxylate isomerase n=1 Tax=Bradyrhizobium sp. AUGA SZCCT0042 TaxID=2807651 RepID=UPI001BA58E49|nr:2-hydroxychromene-2-carboxylate isomerase [Bradyrhizobium sp. AUGA SZCCT0042]MBR1297395.1 2-hydroxychromene-2-carboxylate isomerase [Bradyrhizobium sp. AUGA SZCCT0042]